MNRRTKTAVMALTVYLLSTLLGTSPASAAGTSEEQRLIEVSSSYQGVETRTMVFATGVVNAKGYQTSAPSSGGVGHLVLHFPSGNLIATFNENENNAQQHFNPTACFAAPTGNGKLTITGGSGIYLGATGSLIYTHTGFIIGARGPDGACLAEKAPSKADAGLLNAVGTITLKK